ncbi:MAG: 4Fe-4S binding protein [Proteobacteria bacterium]|nr:4Fe-4S binding protein [Pseudomonadota bacterium]MBU1582043.1 4Fe-4S binding protein [Pseudomonadota bacterium]MBU2454979.1 4Fe-4S binding protein [Pseudomonadota bacterium]MBU2626977.1 4Fe-4S binding protein [Pseudomonadota bacterium]
MTDVYKRLANHLDNLPAGYPATDSGVEIRILNRLFTPKEAAAAMALTLFPEPAAAIAKKLEKKDSDIETLFFSMSKKGLISRSGKAQYEYMAANFINGIWEYQVNNLDEQLIHDVNEYLPQLWEKTWAKQKTQQHRVIPVSKTIPVEMNVMPYEKAESIIKNQSKLVVVPCICRKEQAMIGHGCGNPLETCLMLGAAAFFYEQNNIGRSISQEEALKILNKGIEAGLVLQPSNSQTPFVICMCCGCCCLVLKNLNKMDAPAKIACTNFYVSISQEDCTGCKSCEDICQMGAITVEDESAVVNRARCIGCGLCITRCEFDAITLVEKQASEKYAVPADTVEEYMNMARERGLM